jgi:tetratricopeptide (TPR) repeat protein
MIYSLLTTPNLAGKFKGRETFIALLAAILWAVNPIQTQAVTYIVQRMASMAAMFYIMAMYCYIRGRLESESVRARWGYLTGTGILFLMAIGSKENAILLPASLFLVEIAFFQDLSDRRRRLKYLGFTVGALLAIFIFGWLIYFGGSFERILNGYNNRPFTLTERTLTQFRILIFYLSQIFYPIPQRLSIEHDISLSASLIDPWTTLPCIVAVLGLILWSLFKIHKQPIVSFAVLFFFLNHSIESSIIGLEMMFEHRNYLPSAFLFWPVAVLFDYLLQIYRGRKRSIYAMLAAFIPLVIIGFGVGTLTRNLAWSTEKTLWEDAIAKAPNRSRPYHNLAWGYYNRKKQYDKAMELFQTALQKELNHNGTKQSLLGNIAGIHYKKGNYAEAVAWWNKALDYYSKNELIRYRLSAGLIKQGKLEEALTHLNWLVKKRRDHDGYWSRRGYVLLKLERYADARQSLQQAIKYKPESKRALVNLGAALNLTGHYVPAEMYLRQALVQLPDSALILLWLIDTNLKLDDQPDVRFFTARLFQVIDVNQLVVALRQQSESNFVLFPRSEMLYSHIAGALQKNSERIANISLPKAGPDHQAVLPDVLHQIKPVDSRNDSTSGISIAVTKEKQANIAAE